MKIENLKTRHLCLICLLFCAIPLGAQMTESPLKMPGSKGQAFPFFMANQLPSEQQLAESTASFYPQSIQTDKNMEEQNKNLLFEKPEGPGIALGTSVGNASLFLAFLIILYGIIFRIKDSNFPKNKKQ